MSHFEFRIQSTLPGTVARSGLLITPHGGVETPAFMPVGTQATVKALTPDDLREVGASLILGNTYHLYLRPGPDRIRKLGGLHRFMGWSGPILTDSGGFQVFSLGFGIEHGVGKIAGFFPDEGGGSPPPSGDRGKRLTKIDADGVTFRSPWDGSTHRLTPEDSIAIQEKLGADIILAFDECTSPLSSYDYTRRALQRTHRWARRCLAAQRTDQALFGVVQGGAFQDLRQDSSREIGSLPFAGFAIGGSLGKSKADMHRVLEWTVPHLPPEKPRHLLGIGDIPDLFECVERGIDLFDCVAPTRQARNGALYISPAAGGSPVNKFRLRIGNARYSDDPGPVDPGCRCYTCRGFSRAYLRHLFVAKELLAYRLASLHNLFLILQLVRAIRASLQTGEFRQLKEAWLGNLCGTGTKP